ncbi:MAG: DNA translocase FtsK 4TM domain-containing protein, partial [Gammaproteobacteria bacterium]
MAQAKAKPKNDRAPLSAHVQRGLREGAVFIALFIAAYVLVALVTYAPSDPGWSQSGHVAHVHNMGGLAGAWFADIVLALFGYLAYLIPLMLAYAGWLIFRQLPIRQEEWRGLSLRGVGFIFTLGASCGLASLYDYRDASQLPQNVNAGGILGDLVRHGMTYAFNELGATLLLLALFFSGFTLFTNFSWLKLMDVVGAATLKSIAWVHDRSLLLIDWIRDRRHQAPEEEELARATLKKQKAEIVKRPPPRIEPVIKEPKISVREQKERQVPLFRTEGESELPPLSLLDELKPSTNPVSKEALEAISRQVELKLADFGVEVQVVAVHPGPVVTRYELQPAAGVKVSQITNLAKDLARALSAISVRVVEVIPGKTTVGLEIPNEEREVVQLVETLKSDVFEHAKSPLTLALGKDISGFPVVADLAKMPHLLVAGTTGAGKSVALNAMLLSILYNAKPEDVRLIMIDPKMLELSVYEG